MLITFLAAAGTSRAQFSPGELSRAHSSLEGITRCSECHEVGREISGAKCLACHREIGREMEKKRGYHYFVSDRKCVTCHKEHLGAGARITTIGRRDFDHARTGFRLEGRHAAAACGDCHAPGKIRDSSAVAPAVRRAGGTMLGLRQECASCHEDRHRGSLGTDCRSCHGEEAWKPAPRFDHSRTRYVLTGKHAAVKCATCHSGPGAGGGAVLFASKPYADCSPCHATPHAAAFSRDACLSCHSTAGWDARPQGAFNHDLTRFRLAGRHRRVECEKCHTGRRETGFAGRFRKAFGACADCHRDYHEGEFASLNRGACSTCHTEEGFRPSLFGFAEHERSRFRLEGGHAATPCDRCHTVAGIKRQVFRFASTGCERCQEDVHKGQMKKFGAGGCESCHGAAAWAAAKFDHGATRFALEGKHAAAACSTCHRPGDAKRSMPARYAGAPRECTSCHDDPHRRQFSGDGVSSCEPCHTAAGWSRLVFDHEKQSAFRLTGAHRGVACRSCHAEVNEGAARFVRYKPVPVQCESCHGGKRP